RGLRRGWLPQGEGPAVHGHVHVVGGDPRAAVAAGPGDGEGRRRERRQRAHRTGRRRGVNGRAGLGRRRGRLAVAGGVGGDAVEAVRVAVLPGVGGRRLRRGRLPRGEGPAVVRNVHVVGRDLRPAGVVRAGPADRERPGGERRQ